MQKLVSILGVAALAAAVSFAAITPSAADPAGDAIGAGIAGGMLGFVAGSMITADVHRHSPVDPGYYGPGPGYGPGYRPAPAFYDYRSAPDFYGPGPSWRMRAHIRACFRAYGPDYDPRSNTYIGDDGYEHRCRL